jgi:hypothetical protein
VTQNPSTLRSFAPEIVRPGASSCAVPRPAGVTSTLDREDPPLRAASLRSPALRSESPRSLEQTGCDLKPEIHGRREVAAASYTLTGTGKNSCRAPARIVDAAHELPEILKFSADTELALFMFGDAIAEYLTQLFRKALRPHVVASAVARPEALTPEATQEEMELLLWFSDQLEETRRRFAPHLLLGRSAG